MPSEIVFNGVRGGEGVAESLDLWPSLIFRASWIPRNAGLSGRVEGHAETDRPIQGEEPGLMYLLNVNSLEKYKYHRKQSSLGK